MQEEKHEGSELKHTLWDFIPLPFVGAVLVYCGFLYALSSVSTFPVPSPFSFFDKIVHFFLFGGLSAVVAAGLYQARHEYSTRTLLLIPISFSMLYGLSDEIHQLAVPHRIFSMGDFAADAVGALAAALVLMLVFQKRRLKR